MMRIDLEKVPFIPNSYIPWIIWSIAGLFYFYEIILRMLPGSLTNELMAQFKINAVELGVFTSCYYWAYDLMQIPAGLIVDRYSIRKTLIFATGLCILGFMTVHFSHQLKNAEIGRFIIGFGSSFAYVSALKAASIWLPKNRFGLATCIIDSLGMIGAMFVEIVMLRVNENMGINVSIGLLILMGIFITTLFIFIFRSSPLSSQKISKQKYAEQHVDRTKALDKLGIIIRNPQIWLIGVVGLLFYLPSSVIGDVWGIPYLKSVYNLTAEQASYLMASFFAGWTLTGPLLGAISDKLEKRCSPLMITILLDVILFSAVIFLPLIHIYLSFISLLTIFFLIGIMTSTHPLVFALAKENYPIQIAGTVVAFTNTLIMLGGLLFQPLVGFLLDYKNNTLHHLGTVKYSALDYSFALSIIPISLALSLIIIFFIKEPGLRVLQTSKARSTTKLLPHFSHLSRESEFLK